MTIHAKLHRFLEGLYHPGKDQASLQKLAARFRTSPLFVFDDTIVDLLVLSDSSTRSMKTLAEFGMVHLPYSEMVVQYQGRSQGSPFTWFVHLRERDGLFIGTVAWLKCDVEKSRIGNMIEVAVTPEEFKVNVIDLNTEPAPDNDETYARAGSTAVRLAVLMIHINGLEREVVEAPARLNRQRAEKGREPVAGYSYVHVAKVYDRDGKAHDYNVTGRKMPIHMRSGHARGQWYGKDRSEYKMVWIPPVLVNYKDEDQSKPVLTKKVVA